MKNRNLLFLLCLGAIFFVQPLITKAAEVDFESTANPSTVEIPAVANGENSQSSIAQVIESPSTAPPGDSTNLVIESPAASAPENSTNLVIESPSVSPLLPREVAEAEGRTLERKSREKQNIEQYQASLLAANSADNQQQPVSEETSLPSDTASAVESVTYSEAPDADVLVVESPGETPVVATELAENAKNNRAEPTESPAVILAKKVELEKLTFQCSDNNGIPITVAKAEEGDELSLIRWISDFFKPAGYDAKVRCNQVSARFAAYSKDNPFAYLTTGKMNGQSVVCFTSKSDSGCGEGISLFNGLLFTLKSTDDAQQILDSLVAVLQSKTASEQTPLEQ